ncbi:N-6 DNA methylase [Spirosoma endbachense]|uniref:N-6 DNA methylase n=2 Tax=Spirosoma endbachense TaxID=2666025 RepID=A0A6P1W7E5_9BACT|nr:N-6 DNA methylase [Spirosoma endbachense]
MTDNLASDKTTTDAISSGSNLSNVEEIGTSEPIQESPGPDGLICVLTGLVMKATEKEQTLQSLIRQMNEEYGFDMTDLERDFPFTGEDESGKKIRRKADLVAFEQGAEHIQNGIIRVCFVQDGKTKESDKSKGVVLLDDALNMLENCEFGLWTNGLMNSFRHRTGFKPTGEARLQEVSDFPGAGENMDDLTRSDKMTVRKPANDSLIRTFKRCHDYIYGNQGRTKDAFWQLLYLIFCKIYDEKRRDICHQKGESYRRRFWVGATEPHTEDGRRDVSERIKKLFDELKESDDFQDVFEGNEQIQLNQKALSYVAGELAKYSFLDATVDVKGMAYETIVSNTLKQERGQFFTPRNIVRLMVDMMDPDPSHRVLDPACGSGGFLVMVLDHVRKKIAKELYPELDGEWLKDTFNSPDVNERVRLYAGEKLFGIDFDPDLKRAARMNMVMAGDGHANIFQFNSLEYPDGDDTDEINGFNERLLDSLDAADDLPDRDYDDAKEKFDLIFSNPPFGAKIPINDPHVLEKYDLGHSWKRDGNGGWDMDGRLSASEPPEILFIDRCYQFLKPGGRLAIVLPDGILGNPNTEYVRDWILKRFRVLASVDLPVEAFLPQVGVQASLLFLQRLTETERALQRDGKYKAYDVFMAIAEKVGKDRRGNPIQERDEDGKDIITEKTVSYLQFDTKTNTKTLKERREKTPVLDDDLPKIGEAYHRFRNGERL